jgi:alkylated DNA repair dioxygenase AlkB
VVRTVVDRLEEHLAALDEGLDQARREFLERGVVRVPFLAPDSVKQLLAVEVAELVTSHSRRRELVFSETGNSERRMRNVRRDQIKTFGSIIPALYCVPALLEVLATIAGEEVLECPYEPEQFVIVALDQDGDTHGWHWDDYSFALVWVIDCPSVAYGGFVQYVSHTEWDKVDPRLHQWFVTRPISSLELVPGDLYLMRTDTTLHRVYPVTSGRRVIVNMGYAARGDLTKQISHETMDNLWPAGP